jgi:DNA-binding LytR/AlgR family response regulator
MKIAIFENEYDSVKGAFEFANLITFNNEIEYDIFPASNNAKFDIIDTYSVIFVDIDLSSKSELDGFGLILKIQDINPSLTEKIVILTGNNRITEILKEKGISTKAINIIIKPTDYLEISKVIRNVLKSYK